MTSTSRRDRSTCEQMWSSRCRLGSSAQCMSSRTSTSPAGCAAAVRPSRVRSMVANRAAAADSADCVDAATLSRFGESPHDVAAGPERACRHGQNAGEPRSAEAAPLRTGIPAQPARTASCRTREVLPMPAAPAISIVEPCPSDRLSRARDSISCSRLRPTKGTSTRPLSLPTTIGPQSGALSIAWRKRAGVGWRFTA